MTAASYIFVFIRATVAVFAPVRLLNHICRRETVEKLLLALFDVPRFSRSHVFGSLHRFDVAENILLHSLTLEICWRRRQVVFVFCFEILIEPLLCRVNEEKKLR